MRPSTPRCLSPLDMDRRLLELLVCPLCKGPLEHDRAGARLKCHADQLAFPVRDGIPILLESEAQALPPEPEGVRPVSSLGDLL